MGNKHLEIRSEKEHEKTNTDVEIKQENKSNFSWMSFAFYEEYFKVNQSDVIERIKLSFLPYKKNFIEKISENPDLYGPLWVTTTVVFLLCSVGNLALYFSNWEKSEYIFKPELVRYSVLVVYGCALLQPLLVFGTLKALKFYEIALPILYCIYGYSFGGFIVALILSAIPIEWVQWLLMIYGTLNSSAFLIINLHEHFESLKHKRFAIYGIIGAVQIFLFLMFKLIFFKLIYES